MSAAKKLSTSNQESTSLPSLDELQSQIDSAASDITAKASSPSESPTFPPPPKKTTHKVSIDLDRLSHPEIGVEQIYEKPSSNKTKSTRKASSLGSVLKYLFFALSLFLLGLLVGLAVHLLTQT